MCPVTVKFHFDLSKPRTKARVVVVPAPAAAPATQSPQPIVPLPVSAQARSLAQRLALAYAIQRWLDAGLVRNYADVAIRLGVSRAWTSQISDLLSLSTAQQEQILVGGVAPAKAVLHQWILDGKREGRGAP